MAIQDEDPIEAWRGMAALVRARVAGRSDAELDHRPDAQSMTLRETVHHVAEANVVAASIVIAALGSPGCTYDWSWMLPFGPWMERLQYGRKPLAPTVRLLDALNEYVIAQLAPLRDGLLREVQLVDEPG